MHCECVELWLHRGFPTAPSCISDRRMYAEALRAVIDVLAIHQRSHRATHPSAHSHNHRHKKANHTTILTTLYSYQKTVSEPFHNGATATSLSRLILFVFIVWGIFLFVLNNDVAMHSQGLAWIPSFYVDSSQNEMK